MQWSGEAVEKRRAAIAGLALVVLLSVAQPTHAAPAPQPRPTSVKHLRRLDISRIGKVVNGPRWLEQDKTVGALVQLQGGPGAVRRTTQGSGFQRNQAVRQVKAIQDAAVPKLAAVGATTYGRLSTLLNALQVRVKVSDLDKAAHVPGVQAVQVSQTVRVNNAAAEQFT